MGEGDEVGGLYSLNKGPISPRLGGGVLYNGLYGEALPQKGTFSQVSGLRKGRGVSS